MKIAVTALVEPADRYDLLIYAIGYEARSTYVLKQGIRGARSLGFAFTTSTVMHFDANLAFAREHGSGILSPGSDVEFGSAVRSAVEVALQGIEAPRICVDISSFTRARIARLLVEFEIAAKARPDMIVDFLYVPAAFEPPPEIGSAGVLSASPVLARFRGSLRRASIPIAAVFGLGYELQRAIGALELIEPSQAWAFVPSSDDPRFTDAVTDANRQLIASIGSGACLPYPVLDPLESYYLLDSFLFSVREWNRVVLLPMGPKIFALCCLIQGLSTAEARPAVWRVGARSEGLPLESEPRGQIVGLTVRFEPDLPAEGNQRREN